MEFATLENTLLALVPIEVIAEMHTTTINDNMTAYSTAVGPSSSAKNRRTFAMTCPIVLALSMKQLHYFKQTPHLWRNNQR
jgi:hypothetical protein